MVIFRGKRIKSDWCVGSPPNTIVRCSENGCINSDLLISWAELFLNTFEDDLPRLLLLDGHATHTYNFKFLEIMKSKNVYVSCFPSHTTHWLQAADKSFFRSLKSKWNEFGRKYIAETGGCHLPKSRFFEIFTPAWTAATKPETSIVEFRGTDTWHINVDSIPKSAYGPSLVTDRAYQPLDTA